MRTTKQSPVLAVATLVAAIPVFFVPAVPRGPNSPRGAALHHRTNPEPPIAASNSACVLTVFALARSVPPPVVPPS